MDQITAMRVFARVVEAGSFTRAADSLRLPKPSVTKLVQQLEAHLRVKLLQRTTRRVTVTPEGAAYYERSARVLAELDDIEADLTHAQVRPRGRLRVDIGSSLANRILIPALPAFRARYPDVRLELGVSDRPVDLVGDAVDCVIRGGVLADQTLVARRIAQLPYVVVATPEYLRRHGVPATPAELAQTEPAVQPGLAFQPVQAGPAIVGYFSSRTGRIFPLRFAKDGDTLEIGTTPAVALNESTGHLSALLAGLGIGQTFAFMARPHLDSGTLVELFAGWAPAPHPVYVVYPANRHLSAKLRVFVDWVVEVFAPYN